MEFIQDSLFVKCTKITDWKRMEFVKIIIRFELFVLNEERSGEVMCTLYVMYTHI